MQRYFVAPEQFGDGAVTITGEDARHMARVMRMKPGDKMIVSDGAARTVIAAITEMEPQLVRAEIVETLPQTSEPRWQVSIAQSLPKADKMELVIQKGTEIGAVAFLPFESERNVVQYDAKKEGKRLERWAKIAKEAAEQSHRHVVPSIGTVLNWKALVKLVPTYDLVIFCYEREGDAAHGIGIRSVLSSFRQHKLPELPEGKSPSILIIVGPEGGFSDREATEAEQAGAVVAGLGRRILRTETAGIVGLTCILYEAGEMGGE
ncbi:RsmE family RNA methyltransferase [Paenibacillus sp. strain BS8-2]